MSGRTMFAFAATTLTLMIGCSNDPVTPDALMPQFAKPPQEQDPTASWFLPLDASGLALASDGKFGSGDYSVYSEGVCGVHAKIFATAAASSSGDAIMDTSNPKYSDRKCKDYPRQITLTFPGGVIETGNVFANLHELQNASYWIPVGSTVTRALNLNTGGARCGVLKFRLLDHFGNVLGGDDVIVTRIDSRTWDITTQPDDADGTKHDRAYCDNTGELLSMPLRFRIVSATALP